MYRPKNAINSNPQPRAGGFVQIRAFSKINLILEVKNKRPDGYHNLQSIMQTLSLHDTVTIESTTCNQQGQDLFSLNCDDPLLPTNHDNLVTQAATYMIKTYNIKQPIRIDLKKRIPKGAGLAGGSSDCAATLIGINDLFSLNISIDDIASIGQQFGADVPFCVRGGTQLAKGVGEVLTPLPSHPHCWVVLACPMYEVSTKEVFNKWTPDYSSSSKMSTVIQAIKRNDLSSIAANFNNDLFHITNQEHNIDALINEMKSCGALNSTMSGTGPTVFGYFTNKEIAKKAYTHMKNITRRAFLTEIIP